MSLITAIESFLKILEIKVNQKKQKNRRRKTFRVSRNVFIQFKRLKKKKVLEILQLISHPQTI